MYRNSFFFPVKDRPGGGGEGSDGHSPSHGHTRGLCLVFGLRDVGGGPRYLGSLPLAVPIGLSPLRILTLCGPERVLVVSTEPLDDLSCLTTPGVGCPGDGMLHVPSVGGGGVGTRPWYWVVCLWQCLLASRHCLFGPSVGPSVFWLCQRSPRMTCPV